MPQKPAANERDIHAEDLAQTHAESGIAASVYFCQISSMYYHQCFKLSLRMRFFGRTKDAEDLLYLISFLWKAEYTLNGALIWSE